MSCHADARLPQQCTAGVESSPALERYYPETAMLRIQDLLAGGA